ncbi:hypothetical protein PHYPSEUDO_002559 [Phytophthora pseudosyringae]|uniref:Uncharacterized protein n=1 Tax=Phytophthora pseudosyringae TaxID=221518 RepID=A0A8T1VTD8_9STRA|nr:hypothetical protein PHYPSEUDO_002559 [Phytophthora pseudosyringae]
MIEEEEWSKEQEANRKPGQKHPTPSPGFADRVFYESLLQQRPDSRMAQKWCLEYGVLKWAEAEALCKKLGVNSNVARPAKSPKLKKQKPKGASSAILKAYDESAAAEAMEITSGGFEGVGLGAL